MNKVTPICSDPTYKITITDYLVLDINYGQLYRNGAAIDVEFTEEQLRQLYDVIGQSLV